MITALSIEEFYPQSQGFLTIDVRSEGEYNYGHIPHALNLPLFTNAERALVGTLYKQKGREEAILQGLDIVGPKMSGFINFVRPLVTDNKIFVHCWRGGMRSGSMAWLFNQFGYDVYTLKGGYKSYRHMVLNSLAAERNYCIIGGKTGSGKTEILKLLKEKGQQVIDLEGLANHKGSAFGMLGQPAQPRTEHFENLLQVELNSMDAARTIWLEDESKKIGTVVLDNKFWQHMTEAPLLVLDLPLEERIKRLVTEYGAEHIDGLEQSLGNIRKRLGNLHYKNALDALHAHDFETVARITLHYYDNAYEYCIGQHKGRSVTRLSFADEPLDKIAEELISKAGVH